jgi:hypothetical protein
MLAEICCDSQVAALTTRDRFLNLGCARSPAVTCAATVRTGSPSQYGLEVLRHSSWSSRSANQRSRCPTVRHDRNLPPALRHAAEAWEGEGRAGSPGCLSSHSCAFCAGLFGRRRCPRVGHGGRSLHHRHPPSRWRSRAQKPWCAHSSSNTTCTHSRTDFPLAYGGQPPPAGTGAGADS